MRIGKFDFERMPLWLLLALAPIVMATAAWSGPLEPSRVTPRAPLLQAPVKSAPLAPRGVPHA